MNKQRIVKHAPILREKLDPARRTVTCMLIAADAPDLHGDIMRPPAITAALDSYMDTSQVVGRMHSEPTASRPRRVWQDSAGNAWTETYVADEADWQAIASGAYTGLSWAGYAYRSDLGGGQFLLTEPEMLEYSFVDKPAVPAAVFKSDEEGAGASLAARIASGEVARRVQGPAVSGQGAEEKAEVQIPRAEAADEAEDANRPKGASPNTEARSADDALDVSSGPLDLWPLDPAALAAQLTAAIGQAFDLLLGHNAELAKRLTAAGLQPGPSQRLLGAEAEPAASGVDDKPPAWLR
jgi:hypothetical protein